MVAVEVADVDTAVDATNVPRLSVLPQGITHRRRAAVVGDKDMVLLIFLAREMKFIDLLAGINHGFYSVLFLH